MHRTIVMLALITPTLMFSGLPVALAQDGDAKPNAKATALSVEDLVKTLNGLGYETEKVNDSTSRIKLERGKWSFKVNVGISSNVKKIWMTSYLADIPDIDKVPQGVLAKLLQANVEYGPSHFVLTEGAAKPRKWLKMQFAIDNRNATPSYIREELDYFAQQLQDSSLLWDTTKWARALPSGRRMLVAHSGAH